VAGYIGEHREKTSAVAAEETQEKKGKINCAIPHSAYERNRNPGGMICSF
jgi:hypothetical protein